MSTSPIRVLLVEDSPGDSEMLTRELDESPFGPFAVTRAKRLGEAIKHLQSKQFDAILLDLGLPDSQGVPTLHAVQTNLPRTTPIVVVTGMESEGHRVDALRAGADDYLVKGDFTDNARARSVRYAIERKRAVKAAMDAERRLSLAVEAAQMGVYDWDLVTGEVIWSPQNAKLFGITLAEFGGTYLDFERLVVPEDFPAIRDAIQESLEKGTNFAAEYRVVWPDNTQRWLAARARVYTDADGKPIRMVGTAVDVTARKAAEDAARLKEVELAHMWRVAMTGQLASGIGHELNQPLTAALNYANVCASEAKPGMSGRLLAAIEGVVQEVRRAGTIVARMRAFVHNQPPKHVRIDLNAIVHDAARIMKFDLDRNGIVLHLNLTDGLPSAMGDAVQVQQILVNLMFNAMESMKGAEPGHNSLTLRTSLGPNDRGVYVSVIDSGKGVSQEDFGRLFEPFFTTKQNGLGVGLSLSRSIAESHGGQLIAAINEDAGMTFRLSLPIADRGSP